MEDGEVNNHQQYEIHEGVIFLIELSASIFQPLPELNNKSQLFEILKSINELMSELVITIPKTGIGIYFYNSEETSEGNKEGIRTLFKLKDLNIENMKLLNDLVQDDISDIKKLDEKIRASANTIELPIVLNFVINEFLSQDYFNKKKFFWFINNDTPFETNETKLTLRKIINDLNDYRISLTPIFLDTNDDFNLKLYEEIFLNTNFLNNFAKLESDSNNYDAYGNPNQVFDGASLKTTLSSNIRSKILRLKEIKRIQFTCNLILFSPNLGLSIKGYVLYNHEKPKRSTWLYTRGESLRIVHSKTISLNETSGGEVSREKTRKGYSMGDETLLLTDQQLKMITNFTLDNKFSGVIDEDHETILFPPYLKLIGFRKFNKFRPQQNIGKSVFVTVDNDGPYSNSFKLFSSLYASMISTKRFAIVFGCTKRNSVPSLFALYPTFSQQGDKKFPEGFYLIKLPWKDDLRSVPSYVIDTCMTSLESETSNSANSGDIIIPSDLIASNKKLIKQFFLAKNYDPSDYKNPTLNYFFKVLRMDLLQIDLSSVDIKNDLDPVNNDYTLRKIIDIRNMIVDEAKQSTYIKKEEGFPELKEEQLSLTPKPNLFVFINQILNKITNEDFIVRDVPLKKQEPELTDQDILTGWKSHRLNEFKVNQLKKFIKKHKEIANATKKADIVSNIIEYLQEKFPTE